jgi:hypothetical protein
VVVVEAEAGVKKPKERFCTMSKRGRRASSATSRGDADEGDDSDGVPDPPPSSRKRKRPDPVSLSRFAWFDERSLKIYLLVLGRTLSTNLRYIEMLQEGRRFSVVRFVHQGAETKTGTSILRSRFSTDRFAEGKRLIFFNFTNYIIFILIKHLADPTKVENGHV